MLKRHKRFVRAIMIATLLLTVHMTLWGSEAEVNSKERSVRPPEHMNIEKSADEELAYVLVKLEKQTRQVIAALYGRRQPGDADKTTTYKNYLIHNRILPAAVADPILVVVNFQMIDVS